MSSNIVTTMDLGCALDLVKMSTTLPDARYKPEKFNAVFLTMKDPSSTFTIFQSGKVNSAGNKTVENAKLAADHLVLLLNERLEIRVYYDLLVIFVKKFFYLSIFTSGSSERISCHQCLWRHWCRLPHQPWQFEPSPSRVQPVSLYIHLFNLASKKCNNNS